MSCVVDWGNVFAKPTFTHIDTHTLVDIYTVIHILSCLSLAICMCMFKFNLHISGA